MEQKPYKLMTRKERGKLLLRSVKIIKTPRGWRVPSQTNPKYSYLVNFSGHKPKCECPDCQLRRKSLNTYETIKL